MIAWRPATTPAGARAARASRRAASRSRSPATALAFARVLAVRLAAASSRSTCRRKAHVRYLPRAAQARRPLVIMGDLGDAPHDYAPDAKPEIVTIARADRRSARPPERACSRSRRRPSCASSTARSAASRTSCSTIATRARSLLSNRVDGTTDKNPLRTAILHAEPTQIPTPPEGPHRVRRPDRAARLGRCPKRRQPRREVRGHDVLQGAAAGRRHVAGADPLRRPRPRFNGDHEPINGRCQTSTWQPGDYIVDTLHCHRGRRRRSQRAATRCGPGSLPGRTRTGEHAVSARPTGGHARQRRSREDHDRSPLD